MERSTEQVWQETLVLRAQAGDTAALELLVGIWQRRLLSLGWRLTGSHELARDACQEGWLAISGRISTLEDPAMFGSWARRIVANKSVDLIRRIGKKRRFEADSEVVEEIAGPVIQASAEGSDDIATIRTALKQMPEDKRLVLSLYYLDGLSIARIAKSLGIPHGTVKSRLFHARTELKQLVKGDSDDKH